MRWFILTLILSLPGLDAGTPTEAALEVLARLGTPEGGLATPEDLALSPFCSQRKLRVIEEHWKRRVLWLKSEKVVLGPGLEKIDGDLAGVLIQANPDDGPGSITMIALAMKEEKGHWKVAPLEGVFDNVGLGFGKKIRDRVSELERWMAFAKIDAVTSLQDEAVRKFRETLARSVDSAILEKADPGEAMRHFLDATRAGNTNEALVWMGLLERDEFSGREWEEEIRVTRLGMKNLEARRVWKLLTSGNVMKVIMDGDGDEEDFTYLVSFLSSFDVPPDDESRTPIRFHLVNTSKGWRVLLPAFFLHADESQNGHLEAHQEERNWEDRELSKEMGRVFEERNPQFREETAAGLLEGVGADLSRGELTTYLSRLFRETAGPVIEEDMAAEDGEEEDLEDIEPEGLEALDGKMWKRPPFAQKATDIDERRLGRYQEAIHWWAAARDGRERAKVEVQKLYQESDLAVGVLLIEPTQGSWKPVFQNVWMARDDDGWFVIPGLDQPMTNSIDPALAGVRENLTLKVKEELPAMAESYLAELWKSVTLLDPAGQAVPEEEGRKIMLDWRRLLAGGTMKQLLEKSAIRLAPENAGLSLRNLGHVRSGASAATVEDRYLGTRAAGPFRAFSLMVDEGRGLEMSCPMIVVVPTSDGPRVLVDAEIFLETNKAKRMRNAENLENLKKEMSPEDFAAFQELVTWHEENSRLTWETWNQQKAAQQR